VGLVSVLVLAGEQDQRRPEVLVCEVLLQAPRSRADLWADWSIDPEPPSNVTLWRWLDRATTLGLVVRLGAGRQSDPYRIFRTILRRDSSSSSSA
jgi:hypothetical protein